MIGLTMTGLPRGPKDQNNFEISSESDNFERERHFSSEPPTAALFLLWGNRDVELEFFELLKDEKIRSKLKISSEIVNFLIVGPSGLGCGPKCSRFGQKLARTFRKSLCKRGVFLEGT